MKHYILTGTLVFVMTAFGVAQTLPVSQNQELKKVVIEEFTAFKCGNCPAAHQAAREIGENLGEENVIVIGYHFGSLGAPGPGEPDLRTPVAAELVAFFNVLSRPKGPVNRGSFGGTSFLLEPSSWASNSSAIHMENADANVALSVQIDPNTRIASVMSELFYVNPSSSTHYLTIGYWQNDLVAPQSTYNANWNAAYFNPDGSYNHQHVFRDFVSSREGIAIDASQIGVISESLIYTIPLDINGVPIDLNNLEFFAILHEGENTPTNSNVINAAKLDPQLVVGVDELVNKTVFRAFPNPSNGVFKLENLQDEDEVKILDILGRSVLFTRSGNEFSVSEKGVFMIQLDSEDEVQVIRVQVN